MTDPLKCAIVIDRWKFDIFHRVLTQSGYTYEHMQGPVPNTILLSVLTNNAVALKEVVTRANEEAALTWKTT
jgi:hypothetical protein